MHGLLMKAAARTLATIAKDPKHLGAHIGTTMVLHSWGSARVNHPHAHYIVPGGGIKNGEQQWQTCKKGFFLHVRVLSSLFRRLFVEGLRTLFADERLLFFGEVSELEGANTLTKWCTQQQSRDWVVYAKKPFAGQSQ